MAYDGPGVFLAPYGNDAALTNFRNSVLDGISPDTVEQHSREPPVSDDVVRLWGTKPTVAGTWRKIEPGDYLVFYRDGSYTHSSEVLDIEENEQLAREVWPNFEDDPWDRIIFLDVPNDLDVPSAEIHDLAGYDRSFPLGFSPLNEMGIGGIRGKYGSVEAFAEGTNGGSGSSVDVHGEPDAGLSEEALTGLQFQGERGVDVLEQVESALDTGKHVVFTGPPGTGKTELARNVCLHLVENNPELYSGYRMTTATADWSTFETVGGYMPEEADGENLSFEPGQVLRRFKRDGEQRNELLVIDEINRADIDKAFGQLFTLLSGQRVQLPYRKGGEEIEINPASEATVPPNDHEYVMPESWRLLATMNTYDKTSLYELSYAFMRRFSFVHVDAPTIPTERDERIALLRGYADEWDLDPERRTLDAVSAVWGVLNGGEEGRKIGPAIVRDMLQGIEHDAYRDHRRAVTAAVGNYVLPQLEGSRRREGIVNRLARIEAVDAAGLAELSEDVLGVTIDG